jgi:hypothetical protein
MQVLDSCGDVWQRVVVTDGPLIKMSIIHDDLFFLAVLLSYEVNWGCVLQQACIDLS